MNNQLQLTLPQNIAEFKASRQLTLPTLPVSISDISVYEGELTWLNKKLTELKAQRIEFVKPLTEWATALMEPEKQLAEWIEQYKSSLLTLKKQAQAEAEAKAAEANRQQQHRLAYTNDRIWHETECTKQVAAKVLYLFKRALNSDKTQSITPDIMNAMRAQLNAANFTPLFGETPYPEIRTEVWKDFDPNKFVTEFHNELTTTFADFENAKSHKDEAIGQQAYQTEQVATEAEQTANIQQLGATLSASPVEVELDFKGVKKVYKVECTGTPQEMVDIDLCFINLGGYKSVKVKSLLDLKQSQKVAFIEKAKKENNTLTFKGIKFVEDVKL